MRLAKFLPLLPMLSALLALPPRAASAAGAPQDRLRVLLLSGESRDHDWRWSSTGVRQLLEESGLFRVEVSVLPERELSDPGVLSSYDLLMLDYDGPRWSEEASRNFQAAVEGGTGLVLLHSGTGAFRDWKAYQELAGGVFAGNPVHEPPSGLEVGFAAEHRLIAGLDTWKVAEDAVLTGLESPQGGFEVLATATLPSGIETPVAFAGRAKEGRVFATTLGHVDFDERSRRSFGAPSFQRLLVRGSQWAATGKVTPLRKVAPNTLTAQDQAAGWRLLFDGKSLDGWKGVGKNKAKRWQVDGDAIRLLPGDGEALASEETFRDFELELEWRVAEGAEFAFAYAVGDERLAEGLEFNSARAGLPQATGGEDAPPVKPEALRVLRPAGEYNHARVVAVGNRIEHWLNGIRVLELNMTAGEWLDRSRDGVWKNDPGLAGLKELPLGHLSIKNVGADVWFRNVKIRSLVAEPSAVAEAPPAAGRDLFADGSFGAWREEWYNPGATRVWSIAPEGHVVCEGFALGYLQTLEAWRDFELDFRYRFHPVARQSGPGGILLRMQGNGFYPPCLEVRLEARKGGEVWTYEDFAIEPDRKRTRGRITQVIKQAEARLGEWNRMQIRLEGGELSVRLNGELVNRLSGVSELAGPLGIRSEGVEIHYSDVKVTPLD